MKKILITGKSGFIGSHFPEEFGELNLRSADDYFKLYGCHAVIHLAGLAHGKFTTEEYKMHNVDLAVSLCKRAIELGVKRFVYLSSINVCKMLKNETQFIEPSTISKHTAECALIELGKNSDIEIVIVRSPLVYGTNAPGNFGLLKRLIDKTYVLPFGMVRNQRDFISVQNLAHLLSTCATNPEAAGHTFLASEGETVSTKEFTNAIAKGLGKKIYQLPIPVSLMRFAGKLLGKSAMVEQLVGNLQVDSSDLKKVLGWTPPYTMEESMTLLKKQSKERK